MAKDGAQFSEDSSIEEESIGGGRRDEEDEEFYEEIEAPKFVDFTVPDQYGPDDRYWFCLRVGCDQKHEEEIDHEAISRNFVLRVMAARSPNVRLQKALNRNASGKSIKCPLSAPPKTAKSRLPRLAIVSMSQKMEKVRILPKVNSTTPKNKGKQVAAKYLTTPRNKRILPNSNSFRSVQNPKSTVVGVAKSGSVAKALVFHSPKKTIRLKTSVELRTPLRKLCKGMKKLEITSQRKNTFGCSGKPASKLGDDDSKNSLLLNSSTRQKVFIKEKNRIKNSNCQKDQDSKSLRSGKCKSKGNLRKNCIVQDDDSIAERTMETNVDDNIKEHLDASSVQVDHTSMDSTKEDAACPVSQVDSTSTEVSVGESNNGSQISTGKNCIPRCQAEDDAIVIEGTTPKIVKDSSENQENLNDQATPKFDPSNGTTCEAQTSDDEENTSVFHDENRNINQNNVSPGKGTLGMKNNVKKIATPAKKLCKGSAITGAPGVKLQKPKPTNPKPFRLRTDERGILREANLERKTHAISSQKEVAVNTELQSRDIQGQHEDIQKGISRTQAVKNPQGQARNKKKQVVSKVSRPQTSILERNTCQQDLRNTKSPSDHVLQPHRMRQMASKTAPDEELSLTAKTPSKDLNARTPRKNVNKGLVRSKTPTSSKSSSRRGILTVTIPKEPNFHTTHMPKSCVKYMAQKKTLLSPL